MYLFICYFVFYHYFCTVITSDDNSTILVIMGLVIKIAGIDVELSPMNQEDLRGLNMLSIMRFSYYRGKFNEETMCFLLPKDNTELTPSQCRKYAERIGEALGLPIVFILQTVLYVNRKRLIEQGVYFVVSNKYAFLPTLLVSSLEREKKRKRGSVLSPAAQYILLYYLQSQMGSICTIRDFLKVVPFSYQSIGRALVDLENFGLCKSEVIPNVEKRISFIEDKKELWNKGLEYMRTPIKRVVYVDGELPVATTVISGINALSHYSHLNPERRKTVAIYDKDYNKSFKDIQDIYEDEGDTRIEIWIYPPGMFPSSGYVDKLSLYLSMQNIHDARVEKELEIIIEKMLW